MIRIALRAIIVNIVGKIVMKMKMKIKVNLVNDFIIIIFKCVFAFIYNSKGPTHISHYSLKKSLKIDSEIP